MICGFDHLKWFVGNCRCDFTFYRLGYVLIKHRIPYFISGQSVPNVPIDVEEINKGAIKYARSGISKEGLLNQFSVTRKQLVDEIERIPTKYFYNVYQFGTKK